MQAQDVLKTNHATSTMVLKSYVSDLTDAELMSRPGPGCNHIAWQLGHLIASECHLLESVVPGASATLPDGFAAQHSKENATSDDATKFCTKDQYLELLDKVQAASVAALDQISDARLDEAAPEEFLSWCPTVGAMFVLITTHRMMHAGQFVPVRRGLGKPVLI